MSRPLKIWLIEHAGSLSTNGADEGERVRNGIRDRMQGWFRRVVMHARARSSMPTGFERNAQVTWPSRLSAADLDPRDLVIHFDSSSVMGAQEGQSPLLGPYNTAAGQLQNVTMPAMRRAPSGGFTRLVLVGDRVIPILSVVYVLYDPQLDNAASRINSNVESLSLVAFHEAAHNKDRSNSLHASGGGGIFADIHTGGRPTTRVPNNANIGFLAERIWNWGPQYIVGASLAPQRPPAP